MGLQTHRVEKDSLGDVRIPIDALWGAQTQRAVENFPISEIKFPRDFLRSLGLVKMAAAEVNRDLGLIDKKRAGAIVAAAREVIDGRLDDQFVVNIFQTGSGTSTNMNANEVIANRANVILGSGLGAKSPVHPNDHVNLGQSSNDVIPSTIHITAVMLIQSLLIPALSSLKDILDQKTERFENIIKTGRTHLQDATPIRLGQEFSGYRSMLDHGITRVRQVIPHLHELALGGTAVGTGINTHPDFAHKVIARINDTTHETFREAANHFEAQGSRDAIVEASGALKTVSVSLMKIANDIRWLASGPRNGIGELNIPAVQPGSSIMPGKVNPVMAEALIQVCAQVIGNDATITVGGQWGNFELNVMMPVMAHALIQSIVILARGTAAFGERCVKGLEANAKRCRELVNDSLALATPLAPLLGYDQAAEIAKEAFRTHQTVREVVLKRGLFSEKELDEIFDPAKMTRSGGI